MSTDEKSDFYYRRIQDEKKRARIRIFFSDFLLSAYFFYSFYLLFSSLFGWFTRYSLLSLTVGILVLGLVGAIAWLISGQSLSRLLLYRTNKILKGVKEDQQEFRWSSPAGLFSAVLIALTIINGWFQTEMSFYTLFSYQGLSGAHRIFWALLHPDNSILVGVLKAMVETIFTAFMATFLALPVAFILSFYAARNLMKEVPGGLWLYTVLRVTANFTRSVEPLVWAIIFSVWVGIGPFAGMIALMLHSIASLIKLYSEQIESINRGPLEAIEATGANRTQVVWYAVIPQIVLPYLSFTIYRWDINIRMATVIGLVGGGGVGTLLMQYQGLAQWNQVGTIVIVIALVVWIMDYFSARLREAIY